MEFVVGETSGVLLIGGDFFVDHTHARGVWPMLAHFAGHRAADNFTRDFPDDVLVGRNFSADNRRAQAPTRFDYNNRAVAGGRAARKNHAGAPRIDHALNHHTHR